MYKIIGANNTEYGPVSADQIRQWITEGRINAQTSAQAVGDTAWKPISAFPEFASSFASAPPPPLGGTPPHPSAPIPPLGGTLPGQGSQQEALNQVSGPSIGLMITGALGIVSGIFDIIVHLLGITAGALGGMNNMGGQNAQFAQLMQMTTGGFGIVLAIIKILTGVFVIYGALKMKSLQQHSLAIGAAIVALIPCISPCCCVGIPIGIWALVILNKPDVRNFFT